MRPAPALIGRLCYAWPGVPGTPALAAVQLHRGDYDSLVRGIGPPSSPDGPCVAVMACERPRYPQGDDDVLMLAIARALNRMIAEGKPARGQELFVEFLALERAIAARVEGR